MISKTAQLGGGVFALLLLNTRASPMKDVYEELGCVKDAGHSRVRFGQSGTDRENKTREISGGS